MPSTIRNWLQCLPGTVVLAVALFCAPDFAQASCGDYLTMHDVESVPPTQLVESPPFTCHGPLCSKQPSAPLTPVSPLVTQVIDDAQIACRMQNDARDPDSMVWFHEILFGYPIQHGDSVFHPPRLIAM
jgi:hypothetical protein